MYLQCLVLCCLLVWGNVNGAKSSGDLVFQVEPLIIVDTITQEFSINCGPGRSLDHRGNTALMLDIYRNDVMGVTLIARQRLELESEQDNRTSVEGHLRNKDDGSTFLSINVKDPSFSEEGVYTCRFVYMDVNNEVISVVISANVTVQDIPEPEVLPDLLPPLEPEVEVTGGCNCSEIWTEINSLKEAIAERNNTVVVTHERVIVEKQVPAPLPPPQPQSRPQDPVDDTCRVAFSAKFLKHKTYPIRSGALAPFHDVISNKGGAFHKDKAAFIAPCDGQYFISVTLRSEQDMDSGYVDGALTVDGKEMARTSVFVDQPISNYETATNGVVLSLVKGQEVKVTIKTTSFGQLRGSSFSVFSGFFLFP